MKILSKECDLQRTLTLYRMVTPIGTPFLKEKINN